jgi:REP-associated tyrosine transposase
LNPAIPIEEDHVIYYRRRLPHYQPTGATFFVTTRLAGSLPNHVVVLLKEEQEFLKGRIRDARSPRERQRVTAELAQRYFGKFDEYVDNCGSGPHWLGEKDIAEIVSEALHFRDGKEYQLLCFTIMPNHIHVVFSVQRNDISLYRILQSLKRHTARAANKALGREGAFWHHESYDHVVRDGDDLERILQYVLLNPVKAHFCNDWRRWKWSYVRSDLEVLD